MTLRIVDTAFDGYEQIKRRITDGALLWLRHQVVGEAVSGIGITMEDTTIVDLEELSVYNAFDGLKLTKSGDYDFTGVNFGSNTTDVFNDSGGHINITVLGGGDVPTYRDGTSATTTVIAGAVTVKITAKDIDDNSAIENARVYLEADTGGIYPSGESVTIATSGTTATVTHTSHGMATGDLVKIRGANEPELNIAAAITVTGANTYTYTIVSISGAPGTGSINSTWVLFEDDLTSASGIVTDTRSYSGDQPVKGRVRFASGGPYYKQAKLVETIDSATGLSISVLMVPDV